MRKSTFAAAALLAAVSGAANAAVISINFGAENGSLGLTDSAGNPNVSEAFTSHWNNASGGSGSASGLMDNSGTTTSVAVNWSSALGTWSIPDTSAGSNASGGANPTMMKGYLDSDDRPATVSITGLSSVFSSYKVLIYFDGDNGGNWRVGKYTITDSSNNNQLFQGQGEDSENTNFNSNGGQNPNGTFQVPIAGGTGNVVFGTDPSGNNGEGNFLITSDLTSNAITLVTSDGGHADITRAPINGIQIIGVPVPEPMGLSVLGLGAAGLLGRRRR